MKTASLALFLATAGLMSDVSAAWPRLPSSGNQPIDLASKAIPGTVIKSSQGIGSPDALLSCDPVDAAAIPVGSSDAVLTLSKQFQVETTNFVNDGVEGRAVVSGSTDGSSWIPLGQADFTETDRMVMMSFAGAQVKYLKILFEASKTGSVRNISVHGTIAAKEYSLKFSQGANAVNVNFAAGVGGAKAIYAFPTPTNMGEKEAAANVFKFPKTTDKYRTVVYDLGTSRTMKQFTAVYSAKPVRLQVFAFQELPETKDWRGKLTLDPAIFDKMSPVATGEDPRGVGNIKLTPSKPVKAKYVALRFEPNYNNTGTASLAPAVSEFLGLALAPFEGTLKLLDFGSQPRFVAEEGGSEFDSYGISLTSNDPANFETTSKEEGDDENADKKDTDGDGIPDDEEDSDGDGIPDSQEEGSGTNTDGATTQNFGPGSFMMGSSNGYLNNRAGSGVGSSATTGTTTGGGEGGTTVVVVEGEGDSGNTDDTDDDDGNVDNPTVL